MATRTAQSSGNWADIWDTLPGTGDLINLNGYTVTIPAGYTTAVIGSGSGGAYSVGSSGSTIDIKSGGTLRFSGRLTFGTNCVLRTEGGSIIQVSPPSAGASNYITFDTGSSWVVYNASASSRVTWTRSSTNKPNYVFTSNIYFSIQYVDFSAGGGVPCMLGLKNCCICGGSYVLFNGTGPFLIESCYLYGNASYGISASSAGWLSIVNTIFGMNPAGEVDAHATGAINITNAAIRMARISCYSPSFTGNMTNAFINLGVVDYGYTEADGFIIATGTRGAVKRKDYRGTMDYAVGTDRYTLTPSSNTMPISPFRWPDDDITGMLAGPIPAAEGQALTLAVTVTLSSQSANTVRLVLDPENMYGCYAVSAQATPANTTTQLTAGGTVAAGVGEVLIPWRIEVNDYSSAGVVYVESAAVNVAGVVSTLDQRSMRWIPPVAPTGGGRRRCDFAGVRFAT